MDRIHLDHPFATERRGLPGVIARGNTGGDGDGDAEPRSELAGARGVVGKPSFRSRSFMLARDVLAVGGRLAREHVEDGKGLVELELWIENQRDVNCVPGEGLVALPLRAHG
jgi:hypothetical protein